MNYKFCMVAAIFSVSNVSAIELSQHLSTSINPTPKHRIEPKYPLRAAKAKREGWARFSFIIEADGSVSNVISLNNSGSKDFVSSAQKAILTWQYEPAFENGQPIQRCVNDVVIDFSMDQAGETGVTKRFRSFYRKALLALEEKDYSKLDTLLKKMSATKYMHLSENNFIQTVKAKYAQALGDKNQQLFHLKQIHFPSKDKNETQALAILNQRFFLEIELNLLQSAYNTYKKLESLKAASPYLAQYKEVISKVDQVINSNEEIVVKANLHDDDYWSHALVRNSFSINDVEGELNKIDIRCANKRFEYSFKSNNTWTIPAKWQQCSLYIFGDDEAKFNLIELPSST